MAILIVILSALWALPTTLAALVAVLLPWALKWYKFRECDGLALTWVVNDERAPEWLLNRWKGWGGSSLGPFVVLRRSPEEHPEYLHTLAHEHVHVRQGHVLGPLLPVVYGFLALVCKCLPSMDAYRDNPMEVSARREADKSGA